MRVEERFLEYVGIWTSSERGVGHTPSTLRQFDLAHLLVYQLQQMGLSDAEVDNHCFVYATLPATSGLEDCPHIGFIAHLDTHPDTPGKNVCPQRFPDYSGEDLTLPAGVTLTAAELPHLPGLKGQTLITSDGSTLLGVDDKAGIAEIMTALERITAELIPHGPLSIAFFPDEEVSGNMEKFDLARFGASFAYTVDGWEAGEIVAETFNAVQVVLDITGFSTHTGRAKGKLVNAQLLGMEINACLPPEETPRFTQGREGYYHLLRSRGTVDQAQLVYNVRDFSEEGLARRIDCLRTAAGRLDRQYGPGTVRMTVSEQYRNMKEKILPAWHLIENAERAARLAGLTPKLDAARGGTDGARLSWMGLPCPNLGTGGYAYHSVKEHITVEAMEAVADQLVELTKLYAAPLQLPIRQDV